MATLSNGEVRACCAAGQHLVNIETRPDVTVTRCEAPQPDGSVCGRRHFRAVCRGLDTRVQPASLGAA